MKKILIVEDNKLNMILMCNVIKTLDNVQIIESDGCGDLAELALKEKPDLILMDIQLKNPIQGDEWITRIRLIEEIKNTIIFAVTAFALVGDKERMLKAGANKYIGKPFQIIEFLDIIKEEMNK